MPSSVPVGYFDLQVNGYAGVDFNSDGLTADDLSSACRQLRDDGVTAILATIITDTLEAMCRRLQQLVDFRGQDALVRQIIQGIHIEGPFINASAGYVGAHRAAAVLPATVDDAKRLLEAADGLTRIVTLAPEGDNGFRTVAYLADQGICVSAGHCDPSYEQLEGAIDHGLSMFTHLGNGCPLMLHRHDNIIQRVLSLADQLWIGFIADGVHVPFPALGNYLRCATLQRSFVVSDAIAAAGLGPGTYWLGDQRCIVDDQLGTWAADRSHLMGSASTMSRMVENLKTQLHLSDEQIAQLTIHNPQKAISVQD